MSDNLVLEHLRAIRATRAEHTTMLTEIRERVGLLGGQYASIGRRVDRLSGDVKQVKRRLDIAEAPQPA
jgi:hypothetical protein